MYTLSSYVRIILSDFIMERAKCAYSTACYLIQNDQVLFLHFNKKWGKVFAPPGGKAQDGESPLECMLREFEEETGLLLQDPKLKGYSFWDWCHKEYGIIFIYTATTYKGTLQNGEEGNLSWIPINQTKDIEQFDMNAKFNDLIFEDGLFEGNFDLDEDNTVISYQIRKL